MVIRHTIIPATFRRNSYEDISRQGDRIHCSEENIVFSIPFTLAVLI